MEGSCPSQEQTLAELDQIAPGAPFLALGQTVFWDEPVKALVALRSQALGYDRAFVAGVHDTDYFAKFPQKGHTKGYKALPHNDTTTKGLWSAAGEFSALFGSETIVTRDALQSAGAKLGKIQAERPGYLDEITEAWGWRGLVSLGSEQQITAEKPLSPLFPELYDTFDWAIDTSLELIAGPHRLDSEKVARELRSMICNLADDQHSLSLARYYERLLPEMYRQIGGSDVKVETSTTTNLLRFNRQTANLPRFDLFRLFLDPKTRELACRAYNEAIAGSEIYGLDRFGEGALPFDLYIPGVGRGTLRLGSRGGVVMTPTPVGFSYKRAPETVEDLAGILELRFGQNCVLVGKAVTLIGMLAREFVFVFHEGASSYVKYSRVMHKKLATANHKLELNPILRVKLDPWDALSQCCAWFKLPPPLRRPFGAEELSGCSLSVRWREVQAEQKQTLARLAELRRPLDLIQFLDQSVGGQWNCLAAQYVELHNAMIELNTRVHEVKQEKEAVLQRIEVAKEDREQAEVTKGNHWREKIFDRNPSEDDLRERERLKSAVEQASREVRAAEQEWAALQSKQDEIVRSEQAQKGRQLRRNVAFEAELTRVRLLRDAIVASSGFAKAGHRPAAWWFPLVCPDGTWFRETSRTADFRLEHLV